MIARLMYRKNKSAECVLLCKDGTIATAREKVLNSLFTAVASAAYFTGSDGTWKTEDCPEMSLVPGRTAAIVSDDGALVIYDTSAFVSIINTQSDNYITAREYGLKTDRSAEMIKAYCRQGKIPGAIRRGNLWLIPENAKYPVSEQYRRPDLAAKKLRIIDDEGVSRRQKEPVENHRQKLNLTETKKKNIE